MFSRRMALMAVWGIACMAVPALATLDPVVKPAINKVPDRQIVLPYYTPQPNQPRPNPTPIKEVSLKLDSAGKWNTDNLPLVADARAFTDGRTCPDGALCETILTSPYCSCHRSAPMSNAAPVSSCGGWWTNGPLRRLVSAPVRFFRNGGIFRRWR